MRKAELVYLHALLAETHLCLAERGDLPREVVDAYADHGIGPNQVHLKKAEHEAAIRLLARDLADALSDGTDRRPGSPLEEP